MQKLLKKSASLLTVVCLSMSAYAQLPPPSTGVTVESGVLDGVYVQEHVPTKRVIQYTHLREADVMWSKRIWRTIDVREKMNHPLFYPVEPISDRMSLFDVIKHASLEERTLTIYDPGVEFDDQFKNPVLKKSGESEEEYTARLTAFFGVTQTTPVFDEEGEQMFDDDGIELVEEVTVEYTSIEIVGYYLKEDWFFDKQRSVMDVRIIGIAPMVRTTNPETGEIVGRQELFWLYFPECRYVFQNFFVYNPQNDAQRMSFDDLFWKRDFSSIIHKESNVFDRFVAPTWKGLDALLESERIKEEMFTIEHDVWNL